jgi:hypothetical protein
MGLLVTFGIGGRQVEPRERLRKGIPLDGALACDQGKTIGHCRLPTAVGVTSELTSRVRRLLREQNLLQGQGECTMDFSPARWGELVANDVGDDGVSTTIEPAFLHEQPPVN